MEEGDADVFSKVVTGLLTLSGLEPAEELIEESRVFWKDVSRRNHMGSIGMRPGQKSSLLTCQERRGE